MQQQEPTLASTLTDPEKLATLNRWLSHQGIVDDVLAERERQFEQFGVQDIPIGTSAAMWRHHEEYFRAQCQSRTANGTLTFLDAFMEEVMEFAAEEDPAKARDEIIQVIALGFQIIEAIDRRAAAGV